MAKKKRLARLRNFFRRRRTLVAPAPDDAVVAIDFGTASIRVGARIGADRPFSVPLGRTMSWLPTSVGFDPQRGLVVGERTEALPPDRVITSVKSAITTGTTTVSVADEDGHPQAIEADLVIELLLRQTIDRIQVREPTLLQNATIKMACPAIWDTARRARLARIARRVGLPVEADDLIDEPSAAGAALFHLRREAGLAPPSGQVLLVDAGGGTLDVAVLFIEANGADAELETVAVHGSDQAGDAMDACVASTLRLRSDAKASNVISRHRNQATDALLQRASRELKEELSESDRAERPLFGTDQVVALTRAELDMAVAPVVDSLRRTVGDLLLAARGEAIGGPWEHLAPEIDLVQLAGGATRVRAIQAELERLFPHATVGPDPILDAPEEAVVAGLTFC